MKFAPLHIYSGYTFLHSGLTIDKIVQSIKDNDYFGAALSDALVMYGVPEFINKMEAINKPFIVGMEIELDENTLCLYVLNERGYLNLVYLSSYYQSNEFDKEKVFDELKTHSEGLFAIIDTAKGKIKEKFLDVTFSEEEFSHYLYKISEIFKDFYLGVEIKAREEINYVNRLRNYAIHHGYETIAFPHIKYQKKNDAVVLDLLKAISDDLVIKKEEESQKEYLEGLLVEKQYLTFSGQEYFMSENNYLKIYTAKECENTIKIFQKVSFSYHQKRGEMLHYPVKNSEEYLLKYCQEALKKKGLENNQEYVQRLEYELNIINSMGYADYFLLVQDYVDYARKQNILVGLRGSAASSLVTYLLGIASLDPLKYKLQFERFLNPSRKTMPDIDIDFMDIRRGEVIEYVRNKYGKEKVANITTFQTIQARQALRDIGRIYEIPSRHIDPLSKALTNPKYGLRDSYRYVKAFKDLVDSDQYFLNIVSLAAKIEGLPRQAGLHAAGVICNDRPIKENMPITMDFDGNIISQYEMNYLEEQGFLKMDFLGLTHLSVISRCIDIINNRHPNNKIDKFNIPYDDPKVYELICSLYTMGIFQLESSGMKNAIKTLKPSSFSDVAALLALFRPGPMKEIPAYARRKQNKEQVPEMPKDISSILEETYGIIVYQEQVSEIAVAMAKMTSSEADNFRRAISKKNTSLFTSMHEAFINGCLNNGYSEKEAETYFSKISSFASYGFNKSHAVGYALLSCQMAYLKAYYPLEFYMAILENSASTSDTKFNEYVAEMKKQNIKILPPNINEAQVSFTIGEDSILLPFTCIKEINALTASKIVEEREKNGLFKDIFDFAKRMHPSTTK